MKFYVIDKPFQNDLTADPQLIEGKVHYWSVRAENLMTGETFREWLNRKQALIAKNPVYSKVTGILFYDITATPINSDKAVMMVRFAYLKD